MLLNDTQIIAYFLDENRRKSLNWTGIENQYFVQSDGKIGKGRIKHCLPYPEKYKFTELEIVQLNKAISDLQVSDVLS